MRKDKTIEIMVDNKRESFLITQLTPAKALVVLVFLTKTITGSALKAIGALSGAGSLAALSEKLISGDIDFGAIAGSIESLAERLDEDSIVKKVETILSCITHQGVNMDLDSTVLIGNPLLTLKLVKHATEVNFKSFLGGLSDVGEKLKASAKIIKGDQA